VCKIFDGVYLLASFTVLNEQKFWMCSILAQKYMKYLDTNENYAQNNLYYLNKPKHYRIFCTFSPSRPVYIN